MKYSEKYILRISIQKMWPKGPKVAFQAESWSWQRVWVTHKVLVLSVWNKIEQYSGNDWVLALCNISGVRPGEIIGWNCSFRSSRVPRILKVLGPWDIRQEKQGFGDLCMLPFMLFLIESIPSHQGRFDNIPKPKVKCIFLLTQRYCQNTVVLVVGGVCLKLTKQEWKVKAIHTKS